VAARNPRCYQPFEKRALADARRPYEHDIADLFRRPRSVFATCIGSVAHSSPFPVAPSRKSRSQRCSASPELATRAFQQPYDATVSEIDPMDLATPAQDQQKSIGRLTRLMARSLSMVWQSARTPFLALVGLQLLNAIALTRF
jgi:hypothetical protein